MRVAVLLLVALLVPAAAPAAISHEQWEADIRAFEASDREHPPAPGGVVFVGSSSIQKWATLAEDFPSTHILNRGFGGSELADATYFARRIVTPYRPRLVVLYAGDNDLADGRTPDQVLEDYEAFVATVRKELSAVTIAYVSIKPSPSRAALLDKMRETNAKIRAAAQKGDGLLFVDVFTPMLGPDGQPRPELFGPDRLHMNRVGYELWIRILQPYLQETGSSRAVGARGIVLFASEYTQHGGPPSHRSRGRG